MNDVLVRLYSVIDPDTRPGYLVDKNYDYFNTKLHVFIDKAEKAYCKAKLIGCELGHYTGLRDYMLISTLVNGKIKQGLLGLENSGMVLPMEFSDIHVIVSTNITGFIIAYKDDRVYIYDTYGKSFYSPGFESVLRNLNTEQPDIYGFYSNNKTLLVSANGIYYKIVNTKPYNIVYSFVGIDIQTKDVVVVESQRYTNNYGSTYIKDVVICQIKPSRFNKIDMISRDTNNINKLKHISQDYWINT